MNEKCLYCRRKAIGFYRAIYDDGNQVDFLYCDKHRKFTSIHLYATRQKKHRTMSVEMHESETSHE